jgi:decaprenylphospho-beta-D-ribofuranose 2-oxidase
MGNSSELLSGWGRTMPVRGQRVTPSTTDEVTELLTARDMSHGVIARGLGRSYGDPAQVAGGTVVDLSAFSTISAIDERTHAITVGAGVSIDTLLHHILPLGYFVPVTPGTRQVTIGGAIAADIHGKNHHVDGSFANHVVSMDLITPVGPRTVTRESDPELFWATAGGMGLTGIVTAATITLLPIASTVVSVDTTRHRNLDEVMAAMVDGDHRYRYSVAWVDCMTSGATMGRGVLTRGDHAPADAGRPRTTLPTGASVAIPFNAPPGLLNRLSITAFNEAWYRKAPKERIGGIESISTFFHPLDGVANWNRLYGPRGFVQYQFAVPDAASATVATAIERLAASKVPSFLAVLKRFGVGDPGPLSFPTAGWTLALDLPVGPPALPAVLDDLDDLIAGVGGRIYLAKDARLNPAHLEAMYPALAEFRAVADRVDPERRLTSDLDRRLNLRGPRHA